MTERCKFHTTTLWDYTPSLLLHPNAVFDGTDFLNSLNQATHIIFETKNTSAKLNSNYDADIKRNTTLESDEKFFHRIVQIEHARGHIADEITCSQILHFLKEFAKLYPVVLK